MKVLIGSDKHTGADSGLTPPAFQSGSREDVREQAAKYEWFLDVIRVYGPFDVNIDMGDMINVYGVKNAAETIMNDQQQIKAAIQITEDIGAPENWFLAGTPVHVQTKDGVELDRHIAQLVNTVERSNFAGQLWLEHDGYIIDLRHEPGTSSGVRASKGTPLAKTREANIEWARRGVQKEADLYFRGHLHYKYSAGSPGNWEGFMCPCLEGHTKFGRRLCRPIDVGVGILTFKDKGWPEWKVVDAPVTPAKVFKLSSR